MLFSAGRGLLEKPNRRIVQEKQSNRPDSAVLLHLKDKELSFEDKKAHVLDRGV